MDQNVNYYGIILLLRQLRESGSFSEKELRRVAARIAADRDVYKRQGARSARVCAAAIMRKGPGRGIISRQPRVR